MKKRYYFWTNSAQDEYKICKVNEREETISPIKRELTLYSFSLVLSNIIAEDPKGTLKNKVPANVSDFDVDKKRKKIRLVTPLNPKDLSTLEHFVRYHGGNKLTGREKIYHQKFARA